MEEIKGTIIWGDKSDVNPVSTKTNSVHSYYKYNMLNSYYKHKFQQLGEELMEKANEIGKECTISINIEYKDILE